MMWLSRAALFSGEPEASARSPLAPHETGSRRYRLRRDRQALKHIVDEAVIDGLLSRHELVPVGVLLHLVQRLPRVLEQDLVDGLLEALELLQVEQNLGRGSFGAGQGLVDH